MQSSGFEGYSTTMVQPPQDGGSLPNTGADMGPVVGLGALMLFMGIVVLAALNGWRTPRLRAAEAPAYLQGGVVPSTFNQE